MKPTVTVVIPFYNDPYISQAIQSVLEQSYEPTEIIVVDDGSTVHADLLTPYLPYIHYLGKSNGGTASALNHGIRHASGQYIAWLSSDDMFYRDKIDTQLHFMLDQNAPISYTNFNYIDSSGQITGIGGAHVYGSDLEFRRGFLNGNPVNGCTVMIRRDLFYAVGLFNEAFPYTHDLEFWHRVILCGFRFPFLNECLTAYRRHMAMGTILLNEVIQQEYAHTQERVRVPLMEMISRLERG